MALPAILAGWHGWLILAIILGIGEMITTGFVLLCFSFGALITAIPAYNGNSFSVQLVVFSISSVVFLLSVRKFFLKMANTGEKYESNIAALVGREAIVTKTIENSDGRVKIEGEEWSAKEINGNKIEKGTKVIIHSIEGNKVLVSTKEGEK